MIISKKYKPVLILLMGLLLITSCDDSGNSPDKRRNKPTHNVEVSIAELRPVSHEQILSGTLEASIQVRLHNEEAGLITKMPFHEGDAVTKGTLLVALDNDMIQAELDKARAQHQQAEIDYQRVKKLLPRKLASEEEVARSLTTLNIAKAEEEIQQLRMNRTQIRAPFNGVISQRNNEPGDAVNAHSHILSIIKPDSLLIKVNVSDQWLSMVNIGDTMKLTIDALGDTLHTAHIKRIHPEISATTRKGTIELVLRPVPKLARAGQMARVHFQSQITNKLVIPAHAIHHDIDGAYAYIIEYENNKSIAKKRPLVKGLQFGDWIEILSGIKPGDQLIVKGFLGLRDNKVVTIVNKEKTENDDIKPANNTSINAKP